MIGRIDSLWVKRNRVPDSSAHVWADRTIRPARSSEVRLPIGISRKMNIAATTIISTRKMAAARSRVFCRARLMAKMAPSLRG